MHNYQRHPFLPGYQPHHLLCSSVGSDTCTSLTPNEVGTVQNQRAPTVSLFDSLGKTQIRVPDQYCTISYRVAYSKKRNIRR